MNRVGSNRGMERDGVRCELGWESIETKSRYDSIEENRIAAKISFPWILLLFTMGLIDFPLCGSFYTLCIRLFSAKFDQLVSNKLYCMRKSEFAESEIWLL